MSETEEIKELFAHFGRAMFVAQLIEQTLVNLVVIASVEHGITKARVQEIFQEKSQLTFGQLKRDYQKQYDLEELEVGMLESFHTNRDELTHSFWKNHTKEFARKDLRPNLPDKLVNIGLFFDKVHELLSNKENRLITKYNIDIEKEERQILFQEDKRSTPVYRKLNKNETIKDLFGYKNSPTSYIPIFVLEDNTTWSLCEVGLSQYKKEINDDFVEVLNDVNIPFPIKQFNPRPKVNTPWNYILDLKNKGLTMKVSRENLDTSFEWSIIRASVKKAYKA